MLFLCLILVDLGLDGNCDAVPMAGGSKLAFVARSTDRTPDACVDFCVPDCFCCSRSVTAAPTLLPPLGAPIAEAPEVRARPTPAGVRPVPYHPPLPTA